MTYGPGLAGSLLVGLSLAKGIAVGRGLPLVGVNHLEGHVYSVFVSEPRPPLPFLCLTVSGGHTLLTLVQPDDLLDGRLDGGCLGLSGEGWFDAQSYLNGLRKYAANAGAEFVHGEVVAMTSGPRNGDRYKVIGRNFLRKLDSDGEPTRLRCFRRG